MEDVSAVLVDINARNLFRVYISRDMAPPVNYQNLSPRLDRTSVV